MTEWSSVWRPSSAAESIVDSLVTRMRHWLEDRMPWYDRAEEREKHARTEEIRQRSIRARISAEEIRDRIRKEAVLAEQRFRKS